MNVAQIQTGIQTLGFGSDLATEQLTLINLEYRKLCGERRWWWLEKLDSTLTTTVGSSAVSLATITDFLSTEALRLEVGTQRYDLDYEDPQTLRSFEILYRDTGIPEKWTFVNQAIHFYPWPDRAYTLILDYIYDPPDLVADTPVFPATYHDLLVWGPAKTLAVRERNSEVFQMATNEYTALHSAMVQEQQSIRQRQSSSRIQKSGTYDRFG